MNLLSNQHGFSYILTLTIVMIMGIMLGMVGQSWKSLKQRELEEEMIYRGDLIAEIINQKFDCKNAKKTSGAANLNQFLWPEKSPSGTILDDLVIGKDEACVGKATRKFRLRKSAIIDPMTGKQWQIVKPVGDPTRFAGVMSESTEEPFKKNFSNIYDSKMLDDKKKYSEWQFTWELKQPVTQQPVSQNPVPTK
jgi:hypothetical protein